MEISTNMRGRLKLKISKSADQSRERLILSPQSTSLRGELSVCKPALSEPSARGQPPGRLSALSACELLLSKPSAREPPPSELSARALLTKMTGEARGPA